MGRQRLNEELSKITGISDFSNLSPEDTRKILKLIGEQRLKEAHIRALIEISPKFIELSTQTLKTLSTVADSAKESQKEALGMLRSAVDGLSETLQILSKQAQSDETREKIASYVIEAGKIYIELAKIAEKINSNNNSLWMVIALLCLSVVTLTIKAQRETATNNNYEA